MHYYKEYGGISYWVGDGFCDDINNNEFCYFDNGDCCGSRVVKKFCINCACIGKFYDNILFQNHFNIFNQ